MDNEFYMTEMQLDKLLALADSFYNLKKLTLPQFIGERDKLQCDILMQGDKRLMAKHYAHMTKAAILTGEGTQKVYYITRKQLFDLSLSNYYVIFSSILQIIRNNQQMIMSYHRPNKKRMKYMEFVAEHMDDILVKPNLKAVEDS